MFTIYCQVLCKTTSKYPLLKVIVFANRFYDHHLKMNTSANQLVVMLNLFFAKLVINVITFLNM